MTSEIRVNSLTNRSGLSTVSITDTGAVIAGIISATSFSGPIVGDLTGNVTATTGSFSGDVSIGGTLTYEDVTNIDSVGVVTARSGIDIVGGSKKLNFDSGASGVFEIYRESSGNAYIRATNQLRIYSGNRISFNQIGGDTWLALDTSGNTVTGNTNIIGNVGINSTIPRSKLHVANGSSNYNPGNPTGLGAGAVASLESSGDVALQFLSSTSTDNFIYFGDTDSATTGSIQYDHNVNALSFNVNGGSERLRITSGGNIGVAGATGTDYSLLDGMVINTANGSAGLLINSSSSSHNAYLGFSYGSGSSTSHADQYSAYIGRVGDNTLILGTDNNIRVRIDSSGRTHLGDRSYNNNNTYFGLAQVNICGPDNPPTSMTRAGAYLDIGGTESLVNSMQYISFGFATTHTYKPAFIGYQTINAGAAEYGDIFFATRNVTSDTQPTERLRIASDGNVSIGGMAPNAFSNYNTLTIGGAGAVTGSGIDFERSDGDIYGRIFGDSNGLQLGALQSGDYIRFEVGSGTERARITADGLTFNGDTAAANALDDYEEGTWTPDLRFDGSNTGVTYSWRNGHYTKVGNLVTIRFAFGLSAKGSHSSTARAAIYGIPYNVQPINPQTGQFAYSLGGGYNGSSSTNGILIIDHQYNSSNANHFLLSRFTAIGSEFSAMQYQHVNGTQRIAFTFTYMAS